MENIFIYNNIMKTLKALFVSIFIILSIVSLNFIIPKNEIKYMGDDELRSYALSHGMSSIPKSFDELLKVIDNPHNKVTREKIALGKELFFDTRLSRDESINCASCHILSEGGDDNRATAIGFNNLKNLKHLNSPTVLNAALQKFQFWDGRAKDVEAQAAGPIQAPFEMNMTPKELEERLNQDKELVKRFQEIFYSNKIHFIDVQKAIGAYERTLLTRGAYDEFLDGNNSALTKSAKRGFNLFIQKGCKGCHTGMSVGGQIMARFPLRHYPLEDIGLNFSPKLHIKESPFPFKNVGGFLGRDDRLFFKVPILRNITKTAPYFHNGEVKDLKEVVRIMSKYQLGDEFSKEQIDDVVEFLKSLEGKVVEY